MAWTVVALEVLLPEMFMDKQTITEETMTPLSEKGLASEHLPEIHAKQNKTAVSEITSDQCL
jgi:hypothetical protein